VFGHEGNLNISTRLGVLDEELSARDVRDPESEDLTDP
jgi:hypothetical protein